MPELYQLHTAVLSNGLRVVINEDHTAPLSVLNLWVNVGSRHERPGHTGFAHLFEHLMFQGSRNVPAGGHFNEVLAAGGSCNATTWFDRTNYFNSVPTSAFELACWLEADRHAYLLDAVTQENLDNQRSVVLQEKAERHDNVPYGNALHQLCAMLYPHGHPYHHPTIGYMDDINAATIDDVHSFFREHYHPRNTVACVVGDVEAARAIDTLENHFGHIPAGQAPGAPAMPSLPPLAEPLLQHVTADVPATRLYLGFRLPTDHTPEYHASGFALDILGGLLSSRLEDQLVRSSRLCHHIFVGSIGLAGGTSWGFAAAHLAESTTWQQVDDVIVQALSDLAEHGPTEAEMEAVVAQSERSWLSTLAGHEERADWINHFTTLYNNPSGINTYLSSILTVTPSDVASATRYWLSPDARARLVYSPASAPSLVQGTAA